MQLDKKVRKEIKKVRKEIIESTYFTVDIYVGSVSQPEFLCRKLMKTIPDIENGIIVIKGQRYTIMCKPVYYTFDNYDDIQEIQYPDVSLHVRKRL